MKKRTIALPGVLLLIGLGAFWAAACTPWEGGPRYKGMTVAYWSRAIQEGQRLDDLSLLGKLEKFSGLYDNRGRPAILNGDVAAVPVLVKLLGGDDPDVSLTVRATLLNIAMGPAASNAVPVLTEACKDEDPDVRTAVSRILQIAKASAELRRRFAEELRQRN